MEPVNEPINQPGIPSESKRPDFLTVLCILTWIGSGMAIIGYLLMILFASTFAAWASQYSFLLGSLIGIGVTFLVIFLLLAVGSIAGAVLMWRLNKTGFVVYTICEVAALSLDFYLNGFSIMGTIFSIAFVAMYAANLKAMK